MPLTQITTSNIDTTNSLFFRNRIINGAMMIDQRNAGGSVTVASSSVYTLDRWATLNVASSKFSVQQNAGSVTPPPGFTNYLGLTSLAATSLAAGDYYQVLQTIEGTNISDLDWGKSTAKSITVSFWVRSSLIGNHGGALLNDGNARSYPFSYTINSANTWEYKTITIAGDTSGTWLTTNGIGLQLRFSLGIGSTYTTTAGAWVSGVYGAPTGSVNIAGTNGATFYITGVQLEVGTAATAFERRPYGTELELCQRYYGYYPSVTFTNPSTALYNGFILHYKVTMRGTPTVVCYSTATGAANKLRYQDGAADITTYQGGTNANTVSIAANNSSTNGGSNMFVTVTCDAEL